MACECSGQGCGSERRKGVCWWSPLFIIDYVTVVVLIIVALLLKALVEPYRMFVPTLNITTAVLDSKGVPHNVEQVLNIAQDRMYPNVPEALPTVIAGVVCGAVALAVYLLAQIFVRPFVKPRWSIWHDLHNFALGVAQSVSLLLCVTDVLKPFAGRYRPRYLAIAAEASTAKDEWEGRVSYPSGHSGTAFSTMFYATLYLAGKLQVFGRGCGHGGAGRFLLVVVAAAPTLGAFLVAITRTRDYMHNFSDINAGAIIGSLCALAGYFAVYPSLTAAKCQLPRKRGEGSDGKDKKRDSHTDEGTMLEAVVVDGGAGTTMEAAQTDDNQDKTKAQ